MPKRFSPIVLRREEKRKEEEAGKTPILLAIPRKHNSSIANTASCQGPLNGSYHLNFFTHRTGCSYAFVSVDWKAFYIHLPTPSSPWHPKRERKLTLQIMENRTIELWALCDCAAVLVHHHSEL